MLKLDLKPDNKKVLKLMNIIFLFTNLVQIKLQRSNRL